MVCNITSRPMKIVNQKPMKRELLLLKCRVADAHKYQPLVGNRAIVSHGFDCITAGKMPSVCERRETSHHKHYPALKQTTRTYFKEMFT